MGSILENLIQSKVKQKLLKLFLFNQNKAYHTRELSRIVEEPVSAVQRELKKLVDLQLLDRTPKGNTVSYTLNPANPFFKDLKNIILRTTTEPKDYFKVLIKTESIKLVCLYGDTIKNPFDFSVPVNIFVVGNLSIEKLKEYLNTVLEIFNREYNLLYVSEKDYQEAIEKEGSEANKIMKNRQKLLIKNLL